MIRKIHKNNRNKTDTCLEGWGVGDTHFTGSHIGGIHISLEMCVRGYTYPRDTGAYFRNFTVSSSFREERVGGYTFRSSSLDLYVSRFLCAFSTLISGKWSLFAISLFCFSLASRLVSWPVCLLFSLKVFLVFFGAFCDISIWRPICDTVNSR